MSDYDTWKTTDTSDPMREADPLAMTETQQRIDEEMIERLDPSTRPRLKPGERPCDDCDHIACIDARCEET